MNPPIPGLHAFLVLLSFLSLVDFDLFSSLSLSASFDWLGCIGLAGNCGLLLLLPSKESKRFFESSLIFFFVPIILSNSRLKIVNPFSVKTTPSFSCVLPKSMASAELFSIMVSFESISFSFGR